MRQGERYLAKNGIGIFIFVRRVPKELQAHLNIKYIRRSLKTRDYKQAVILCRKYAVSSEKLFQKLRQKFCSIENEFDFLINSEQELSLGQNKSCTFTHGQHSKSQIGNGENATSHKIELLKTIVSILADTPDCKGKNVVEEQQAIEEAVTKRASRYTIAFSNLCEKYIQRQIEEKKWTREKNADDHRATFKLFEKFFGNQNVHLYSSETAEEFRHRLRKIPKHWTTNEQTRVLSYEKVIKLNRSGLTDSTICDHLKRITGLFKYAKLKKYADENIFDGVAVSKGESTRSRFTEEELHILFAEENFINFQRRNCPSRYWAPLLAAHTSCRVNEIFQLTTEDVYQKHGIWVIDINANGSKTLKTKSSARLVPIHEFLIRCGFLEWVDKRRGDDKNSRLFKEYEVTKDGRTGCEFSAVFSAWIQRTRNQLGSHQQHLFPKGRGIHSLRHLFVHEAREVESDRLISRRLAGHAVPKDINDKYGGPPSAKAQQKELECMNEELQRMQPASYFPPIKPYLEIMILCGF